MNVVKILPGLLWGSALIASCGGRTLDDSGRTHQSASGGTSGSAAAATSGAPATQPGGAGSSVTIGAGGKVVAGTSGEAGSSEAGGPSTDDCGICAPQQACIAGRCIKDTSVFVPAAPGCGGLRLALKDDRLYWTDKNHGTVKSLSTKVPGPVSLVAVSEREPEAIFANGHAVYWLSASKHEIKRWAGPGDAIVLTNSSFPSNIGGFAVSADDSTLYFAVAEGIHSIATSGDGAVSSIGQSDSGLPRALAVEKDLLAITSDIDSAIDVLKVTPNFARCTGDLVPNVNCSRYQPSQGALNFDNVYLIDSVVYWANENQISGASGPGLRKAITNGSDDAGLVLAWSISNAHVYLMDDSGTVTRAPLRPNAPRTELAVRQMGGTSIVADLHYAYWATADCAIISTPLD